MIEDEAPQEQNKFRKHVFTLAILFLLVSLGCFITGFVSLLLTRDPSVLAFDELKQLAENDDGYYPENLVFLSANHYLSHYLKTALIGSSAFLIFVCGAVLAIFSRPRRPVIKVERQVVSGPQPPATALRPPRRIVQEKARQTEGRAENVLDFFLGFRLSKLQWITGLLALFLFLVQHDWANLAVGLFVGVSIGRYLWQPSSREITTLSPGSNPATPVTESDPNPETAQANLNEEPSKEKSAASRSPSNEDNLTLR